MEQNLAAVLLALFDLARDGQPAHMGNLADRIGISRKDTVQALVALEKRGLCEACRARLTMKGLVVVASLRKAPKRAQKSRAA
jgi:Mn-dependent DtxR family transcriptional regulator